MAQYNFEKGELASMDEMFGPLAKVKGVSQAKLNDALLLLGSKKVKQAMALASAAGVEAWNVRNPTEGLLRPRPKLSLEEVPDSRGDKHYVAFFDTNDKIPGYDPLDRVYAVDGMRYGRQDKKFRHEYLKDFAAVPRDERPKQKDWYRDTYITERADQKTKDTYAKRKATAAANPRIILANIIKDPSEDEPGLYQQTIQHFARAPRPTRQSPNKLRTW
jgi:hypothetical protein